MPASGKVLEDSIRLSRIRRIKQTLYIVQAIMLIALGILLIAIVGGAMIKPYLYLPIASFLAVVALLLLIISIESFFFRMLEVKFARSSSARHLMAKNSMKRAIFAAILAGSFCAILILPPIISAIENSAERTVDVSPTAPPTFYSSDTFNLARTDRVEVSASTRVEVYLMDDDTYTQYYPGTTTSEFLSIMFTYRLNTDDYIVEPGSALIIDVPDQGVMRYHLVLNDFGHGISARATIMKEITGTLTGFTSLLLLSLVAANIAWFAYLVPVERRYSSGSIYR